ncbi:MAG: hydroxymethylglutaryl-CoA lyase [Phycisphaerales bacterium]
MPDRVRITDVSPRDGLQNEPGVIPTADKVRLVEHLCRTGVDEIEVSSFVSAKWIPQLGDAAEVFDAIRSSKPAAVAFSALVPNEKGMEAALAVNARAQQRIIDKVSVFTAASETFCKKNINATFNESLERFRPVVRMGDQTHIRAYLSCVIACPFEGPIAPARVAQCAFMLYDLGGITEIDLGDTIGAGTPQTVQAMLTAVLATWESEGVQCPLTLHLHDTFGRAADCVKAALDLGVRSFDGSVAGLGGCPYAGTPGKRAPGNIATELLVRTIHGSGYTTGVDLEALAEAAAFARRIVAAPRAPSGGTP